jgi:streptomycin 6-kinase
MIDGVPATVRAKADVAGAQRWLADLPDLVAELERDWSITVGPPYQDATEAFVAPTAGPDGGLAVLKLLVPRGDDNAANEITALRLAGGTGCARLLRDDVTRGALLVERLGPSLSTLDLPIGTRHEILCTAASQVWRPAPDCGLPTGAQKGQWLIDHIVRTWTALGRPGPERTIEHALDCARRRIAAHDDERALLVHGDVHQWNALLAGEAAFKPAEVLVPGEAAFKSAEVLVPGEAAFKSAEVLVLGEAAFKLVDPDGLLAEPEYDLGIIMREDPLELMHGDPGERARWLAARTGLDPTAVHEWGVVERVSTGLMAETIGMQPIGREMLAAADRIARDYPAI